MAKYDPDRIAETADPYAPGASGIEPLCDEFGRLITSPLSGGGGGGGGDASAANQVLGLTALDSIYDALQLVGTEATSADILAAVNSLGDGATLADLAAALAPLATEATQQDVLAALEAQAIDVGLIQTNVALLVPDVDAMKDSLASIDGKIPASPAQDRTTFGAPFAVRVANAGATGFVTPFVSGDSVAQSGTWNITNISGTISLPTGAATSAAQTDGSQKSIVRGGAKGSTTATDITSTASGANHQAIDVVLYDTTGVVIGRGDTNGLTVQGTASEGVGHIGKPIAVAGGDGSPGNVRTLRTDSSGRVSTTNNRIGRTAHLSSATLPAAGAFTSQTPYTVPEGVVSITAYVTYTRGAAGGQVKLRPQWANGTETAYETAVSGSAASGGTLRNQIELREILGPIVDTASAVTFLVQFEVPAGCTTFAMYAAEFGVTGTPGTCAITLTARYGS